MSKYAPDKVVIVQPFGYIDIAGYEPLLCSRQVQMLKKRTQLSLVREVCVSATHTRYAHSLGVMGLMGQMLDNMFARGLFEGEDRAQLRRELGIAALLHDVGHPPYSHQTEYVIGALGKIKNHKQRTQMIIRELDDAIRKSGSTSERIISLLDKKNGDPRGRLVVSKSVGADKIGYLYYDQRQTGHNAAMPGEYKGLLSYLCFAHGDVCVEEKATHFLDGLQRLYLEMWTQVYLRKQALSFGRILQKGVQLHVEETGLDPDVIWGKSEGWLDVQLEESPSRVVRELEGRVACRAALKTAISLKLEGYVGSERVAGKPIEVVGLDKDQVAAFLRRYETPLELTSLEKKISQEFGLKESEVVVTVIPEPEKLVPEDVKLVTKTGESCGTLFERLPRLHESLKEEADDFFAVRVMVPPERREEMCRKARGVVSVIADDSGIAIGK